jgi:hypothetical protein
MPTRRPGFDKGAHKLSDFELELDEKNISSEDTQATLKRQSKIAHNLSYYFLHGIGIQNLHIGIYSMNIKYKGFNHVLILYEVDDPAREHTLGLFKDICKDGPAQLVDVSEAKEQGPRKCHSRQLQASQRAR